MIEPLRLIPITADNLKELWDVSYGPKADKEWMKYDGPYFNNPIYPWEEFSNGFGQKILDNPNYNVITHQDKIVGIVSAYWSDGNLKQWLEVGIALYDKNIWGQGFGSHALRPWLKHLFDSYPYLPHIGFTTWSGNLAMQKIGEKNQMTKEGVIRKVRFWNNQYYGSIKYGILREEYFNLYGSTLI